jgi:hypothetical protein
MKNIWGNTSVGMQPGAVAAELKRRITDKTAKSDYELYITQPVLGCDLGKLPGMTLVAWMHFNPLGPTTSALFYTPVPETEEGLLMFRSDNPFERQQAAFGVMPHEVAAEEIGRFAFMLFTTNGHESCPFFGGLPTSIAHEGNWRGDGTAPTFNEELTRTLFKGAAHAVWPADMPVICDYLRRYKADPWKRTAAEFDEGLLSVLIRSDGEQDSGFHEELFDEWFDLVTDPEHLQSERSNFSAAWQGAINFKGK